VRAGVEPSYVATDKLSEFIAGRYPVEERDTLAALPSSAPTTARTTALTGDRPIAHVLIPIDFRRGRAGGPLIRNVPTLSFQEAGGLDGVVLDIPALKSTPGADGLISLNIRVKDPLWPLRDLLDVNVAVKPGRRAPSSSTPATASSTTTTACISPSPPPAPTSMPRTWTGWG
jgi:hypothetical protein